VEAKNAIRLTWEYPSNLQVRQFFIYKGKNEESPTLFKKINSAQLLKTQLGNEISVFSFEENGTPKTTFHYQVIAKHEDGGYSPLTAIKTVLLE